MRRHVAVSLALEPVPPRSETGAEIFGRWAGDGYTCEKVFLESLPGFYLTGNLFRPLEQQAPERTRPAILCPHGHWADGRLHDRDPRGSIIARCVQFAKMGGIAFSYDMVGYNDSCQLPHGQFENNEHYGLSLMALQAWNSLKALDFITELPDVDDSRIGVTGASGGATQTIALAAVDERISVSAPVCMISLNMQGGCLCENAPLLRIDATNVEIASLFAPKPMFIGSCTGDWTRNTEVEELPVIRNIYNLYGAAADLMHHHVDFEHNYNLEMREHVYGFLNKHLLKGPSAEPVDETYMTVPPHRDRLVWWGREAPRGIAFDAMKRIWRKRAEETLRPLLRNAESARASVGKLLPHVVGVTPASMDTLAGRDPHGIGIVRERNDIRIQETKRLDYPKTDIDFFSTYNRTPFAERVHEILGLVENIKGDVNLVGVGNAGPAVLVAAAISNRVTEVDVDMCGFDVHSDADWHMHMDTPAIRQVGGVATILSLIGSRPLTLRNAPAELRELQTRYAR